MSIDDHTHTIDSCRFCFMCRHVCTVGVVDGRESDTPRGRALILSKLRRGYIDWDSDLIDALYRCCLCGLCEAWCQAACTPPAAVQAARAQVVARGLAPERAREIRDNVLRTGNPFGLPHEERFRDVAPGDVGRRGAALLYYVGCDAAYRRPEIARAFLDVLHRAGADVTLLGDERSTGKPLAMLGYRDDARAAGGSLADKIRAAGCGSVVTTCPSAFEAFRVDYPAMGIDLGGIEILHATQLIDRLLAEGRIEARTPLAAPVTLLDGTALGRHAGLYDEPRRILDTIAPGTRREMTWTRQFAHSSGEPGGVFPLLHPELGRRIARRVLDEAARTGAAVLATTCPATKHALLDADPGALRVCDLVELVADALD